MNATPPARLNHQERLFLTYMPAGVRWYSIVLVLCEPPDEGRRPRVEGLRELAGSRLHLAPPRFRQRVLATPLNLAGPVWVDDDRFEIGHHIRPAGLGDAPTTGELERLVCRLAGGAIEMDRPLWDVHVVERLADGRAALVIRAHHAMLDGRGMTMFVALLADLTPEPPSPEPPQPWTPAPAPSSRELLGDGVRDLARHARGRLAQAKRGAVRAGGLREGARATAATLGTLARELAPRAAVPDFSRKPTGERALSRHELSLDHLRGVAHRHDAKVNDAVAAVLTDAVRRFLERRGLPLRPVKVLMPVAVEAPGEGSDADEHVGFLTVALPVDEPHPVARLGAITAQTHRQKETHAPERVEWFLEHMGDRSDRLYRLSQHLVQNPHTASFTISNVRGPDFAVYVRGARVTELHPVIPLGPRHTVAVGVVTLERRLFVAVVRDPRASPNLDALPACVDEAIAAVPSDYDAPATDRRESATDG